MSISNCASEQVVTPSSSALPEPRNPVSEQALGKVGCMQTLAIWFKRSSERKEIRKLARDPDLLKDVGISNYDAYREGNKRFWQE